MLIVADKENREISIEKDEAQIRTFIENGREFGVSKLDVLQKLTGKFDLDYETAGRKLRSFGEIKTQYFYRLCYLVIPLSKKCH